MGLWDVWGKIKTEVHKIRIFNTESNNENVILEENKLKEYQTTELCRGKWYRIVQ